MSTSTYHHGNLRAALVEAARALLRDMGPADLSLRAVARAAGVSAMAPYRHFADKEALLAGVAAQGFDEFAQALRAAAASGPDPSAALKAQGVAYIRFACGEPTLFRLMFGPVIGGQDALHILRVAGAPAYQALQDAVCAVFPAAGERERDDYTLACWALAHGLACLIVDGNICAGATSQDIEAQSSRILELLFAQAASR